MFKIEIDYSPAYELITSLYTYLQTTELKITEVGVAWHKSVKELIDPNFQTVLKDKKLEVLHRLSLLVWQCKEDRSAKGFIDWLEKLSPSEVYTYLVPWVEKLPKNMNEIHLLLIEILKNWNEQYFSKIDSVILDALKMDVDQKRGIVAEFNPTDFVENCTNGIRIESPKIEKILLIPQYHNSPHSIVDYYDGIVTCSYPVDIEDGDLFLKKNVSRQIRALSDRTRVQILKFLYTEARTFSDIQKLTGLVKSNVNYHLKLLRTAGLIRAHHNSQRVEKYSLREEALKEMNQGLFNYIEGVE